MGSAAGRLSRPSCFLTRARTEARASATRASRLAFFAPTSGQACHSDDRTHCHSSCHRKRSAKRRSRGTAQPLVSRHAVQCRRAQRACRVRGLGVSSLERNSSAVLLRRATWHRRCWHAEDVAPLPDLARLRVMRTITATTATAATLAFACSCALRVSAIARLLPRPAACGRDLSPAPEPATPHKPALRRSDAGYDAGYAAGMTGGPRRGWPHEAGSRRTPPFSGESMHATHRARLTCGARALLSCAVLGTWVKIMRDAVRNTER